MKLKESFLLISFLISLLMSCSEKSFVGGDGGGSDAGEAYGLVLDTAGQPVANTAVYIYAPSYIYEPYFVDSLLTDENGKFSSKLSPITFVASITKDSFAGLSEPFFVPLDTSIQVPTITLIKASTIQGTIKLESTPSENYSMYLGSSPYFCATTSDKDNTIHYICDNVVPGTYNLFLDTSFMTQINAEDQNVLVDTLSYQKEFVLLEDWKIVDTTTNLEGYVHGSQWLTMSDGSSTISPDFDEDISPYFQRDSINNMHYLSTTFSLDTAQSNPWAQLFLKFGNEEYDFTTMDSICVTVRGDAEIKAALAYSDTLSGNVNEHGTPLQKLSDEWKNICFDAESFDDSGDFHLIDHRVNRIKFTTKSGSWVDYGPIRIHGLDIFELKYVRISH